MILWCVYFCVLIKRDEALKKDSRFLRLCVSSNNRTCLIQICLYFSDNIFISKMGESGVRAKIVRKIVDTF